MAAIVQIGEKNGAGGAFADKTGGIFRFKQADNATVDYVNPIPVPAAGSNFSYEKWGRLRIGGTGPAVQITNAKFYTDGANNLGTGILLWVKAVTAYATPAQATATAGYTNAFTYTSGSPLALGAGPYSAANTEFGDHTVMMMEVQSTAGPGTPSETMTWAYDEI